MTEFWIPLRTLGLAPFLLVPSVRFAVMSAIALEEAEQSIRAVCGDDADRVIAVAGARRKAAHEKGVDMARVDALRGVLADYARTGRVPVDSLRDPP
jgi:hypothetical protein